MTNDKETVRPLTGSTAAIQATDHGALSLGSLGLCGAATALTCDGTALWPMADVVDSPVFPVSPRRFWHANGTVPFASNDPWRSWSEECLSLSRRQFATLAGRPTGSARVCLAIPLPA